jgi:tRNA nucleotidyltransferase/poly(A) polymerase
LKLISRERIRDEWHKMLLSSPATALDLLRKTDSLRHVISRPQTFDVRVQDPWGRGIDPWELAGEWATRAPLDLALRYGIILTAIGAEEPRIEKTIQELKLSTQQKKEIKSVCHFAKLGNPRDWNDLQWRQLFYKHGADEVWRGCMLHATIHEPERMSEWDKEVESRKKQQPIWSLADLAITGQDLMATGVPAGPAVGKLLQRLAESVLRDPMTNRREDLLHKVEEWK